MYRYPGCLAVLASLCLGSGCKFLFSYDPGDASPDDRRIDQIAHDTEGAASDTALEQICEGFAGRIITIDSTEVVGGNDLPDFPLLVTFGNDTNLELFVHHASGVDIYFTHDDGTPADYEIEHYDAGTLVAWVKIPVLSATEATSIVMCYGNPAITAPRATAADVWDSSYMAVWHLKADGSGASGEFVDSTHNGNHGQGGHYRTSTAIPKRVSGMFGWAQSFDGEDDHIHAPNSKTVDLAGATEMTVEAWVWNAQNDLSTLGGICSKLGFSRGYRICTGNSHRYWCQFGGGDRLSSSDGWRLGVWQHVAAMLKGGQLLLYIDGDRDPKVRTAPLPSVASSSENGVMIGHGDDYIDREHAYPFSGRIDEVRISSVARSSDWIATQYNNYTRPSDFYSVSSAF